MSAARDGMTVAELIRILSVYDKALVVRFTSSECGGKWPCMAGPSEGSREAMAVFVDEQIGHVDASRVGGGNFLTVGLLRAP